MYNLDIMQYSPICAKITHIKTLHVSQRKRPKWYGHVKRWNEGNVLIRMLDSPMPGKRKMRRQNTLRKDMCKKCMETVWLNQEDYWTGKRGRMIFKTIPAATPDDEENTDK